MAEHFYGKKFTVHFSNGAAEDLFRIFIEQSEKLPKTKSMEKTIGFLKGRLEFADGAKAFAVDEDCEIEDEVLLDLANIIQLFANELSKEIPSIKSSKISWDRDLRLSWLARIANLYLLIEEYLKEKGKFINRIQINLPLEEKITFELKKLLDIYHDKNRKGKLSESEAIEIYQKIVDLSEKESESVDRNYLASIYLNYISLLNEQEHKAKSMEIWRKFLMIAEKEGDIDGINLAKEFLNES